MKSIKKLYYQLPEKEFKEALQNIMANPDTMHFFNDSNKHYFYLPDSESFSILLKLHEKQALFDNVFNSFSSFGKNQIIQSFYIDEVESTNKIENIYSTRHDIFYLLNNYKIEDNKTRSIANSYSLLLNKTFSGIHNLKDIRNIYDSLTEGTLADRDLPDGVYFRKGPVFINDGLGNVHNGVVGEDNINNSMNEFLNLYNDKNRDIYERMILSHFLIETIHPYYDGNGRLGRFLNTMGLFYDTGSYISFEISRIINNKKTKYYHILEAARDIHEYGSLNNYVKEFGELLSDGFEDVIKETNEKRKKIEEYKLDGLNKSEKKIFKLLAEATALSEYGVTNKEIIDYTGISKRNVIYIMNKFRDKKILAETKISKYKYNKLNID